MQMHHFNVDIAVEHGIEKAILLNYLAFWIETNQANNRNYYDGHYWTYNTSEAFGEIFPYMNPKKIARLLNSMEEDGLIVSGNHNKSKCDRTKWFAIVDFPILQKCRMHSPKMSNAFSKNVQPIPVIDTVINTKEEKENFFVVKKTERKKKETNYPFINFYNAYPKIGTRAEAEKVWNKLSEETRALAIKHIPNYVKWCESQKRGTFERALKDPVRYLSNKVWVDFLGESTELDKPKKKVLTPYQKYLAGEQG